MEPHKLKEYLNLPFTDKNHINALRYMIENEVDPNIMFEGISKLDKIHQKYNELVLELGIDESCLVKPTDTTTTIRKKCKKAFGHGLKLEPMRQMYAIDGSSADAAIGEAQMTYNYGVNPFDGKYKKRTPPEEKYTWTKKMARGDSWIAENEGPAQQIGKFLKYACEKMQIKNPPKIGVVEPSEEMTTLGMYNPVENKIGLVIKNRLMADILRTLAHELVHVKQNELGKITSERDGEDGSEIENQANATAGVIMRKYGRENKDIYLSESLLLEGGAAGHMSHPFEDEDLTFAEMKDMIDRALVGSLDMEEPATEKLDGQNIAFSVRDDGTVVFARNKGHVKNKAQNALDVDGIKEKFKDRGSIEKAFVGAAEDLQTAVESLSDEQKQELFAGGSKFMNIEIILPDSRNVIPYSKSVLVMHGTIEYDDNGNEVGRDTSAGGDFAKAVREVGEDRQRVFGIEGPRTMVFDDSFDEELSEKAAQYKSEIDKAVSDYGLSDSDKLKDYRRRWWLQRVSNLDQEQNLNLSKDERLGLVRRWADGNKTAFGVRDFDSPEKQEWFRSYESDNLRSDQKKMIKPIEYAFLKTGAQALRRVTNFMAANNPRAADIIEKETTRAIQAIKDTNDPDLIGKMQQQFNKLEAVGLQNLVPSEGIVFTYNGSLYKFTGTFAPINQITGTFKFGMPEKKQVGQRSEDPPREDPVEEPDTPEEAPEERRTVAVFSGRFHPFHKGHYSIYQHLVDKFGEENVFIGSSNKQKDPIKQPFSFDQKKEIITKMFGVPEDHVVQVKNPYAPKEILDQFPPDTVFVTAVGEKDASRLAGSKYFKNITGVPPRDRQGFQDRGYFVIAPNFELNIDGKNISGTALRHVMGSDLYTDRAKKEIFTKVYGRFDQNVFDMMVKVTSQSEEEREITQKYTDGEQPTDSSDQSKDVEDPTQAKSATDTPQSAPTASGEEEPSGSGKEAEDDPEAKQRAKAVLGQKIKNPETGRMIYVATALKYDPSTPAHRVAKNVLKKAMISESVIVEKEKKSTERVRKYYRNNPGKVRKYLRKTQDDRVKRNKDRREAERKYGKEKMKNHDVHHPNGPDGKWELAKKDHGRDKKDGTPPPKGPSDTKSKKKDTKKKDTKKDTKSKKQKKSTRKKDTQKKTTQKKKQPSEKFKVYLYTKDYSKVDMADTIHKYFNDERLFKTFPDLASDIKQLRSKIMKADRQVLDKDELKSLQNSKVPEIMDSDSPAETLVSIEDGQATVDDILNSIKNEEEVVLPVVISYPGGLFLLSGDLQLSALAAIEHTVPVKVIPYEGQPAQNPEIKSTSASDDSVDRAVYKKKLDDVLNMKITNPETGNRIKIDTAMDYDKNHIAHQIALNVIRQQLGHISPRAGIPKNTRG